MAELATIARPYAEALFQASQKDLERAASWLHPLAAVAGDRQRANIADTGAVAAVAAQQSNASVDGDEETINLLTYQTAYQATARVLTAMDEALDLLINRTGLVGR